jgi:translation initiation factor IF-2
VLKCDVAGTVEAVAASLESLRIPGADLEIIQSGIGNISESDLLMAQTGSRLVIGFNVDTMPKLDRHIRENGIEVRLYDTIYTITADVKKLARHLKATDPQEKITGKARIIATFKGVFSSLDILGILSFRDVKPSLRYRRVFKSEVHPWTSTSST